MSAHNNARPNNGYGNRPVTSSFYALSQCGRRVEVATRKAEVYADCIWKHMVSPNLSDAVRARVAQGTKILTEGGNDKVFQ